MNYFLSGSENYLLQNRRRQLFKEEVGDQGDVAVYYGKDWNMDDVIMDCQSMSFLSEKKAVILENPEFIVNGRVTDEVNTTKLIRYLQDPNPDTCFILYVDQEYDRKKKIITTLAKYLKREVYDTLKEEDFRNAVISDIRESGLKLDNECINEILARLPLDLSIWKNELEKLKLYPGKMDKQTIRALVSRNVEDDVFELSQAVVSHKLGRAMSVYRDLLVNYRNNLNPIIGLLGTQFRSMCMVRAMNEMGSGIDDIAAHFGKKSYWAKMCLQNSSGKSSEDLLEILSQLAQLDQDIKTGKVNAAAGLELFIVKNTRREHGVY